MALTDKLSAIGTAIRAKTGKSALMTLDEMPTEIASISGGGGFDTSQLTGGYITIQGFTNTSIDLTGMDASGFTSFTQMFNGCSNLQSVDLSPLAGANPNSIYSMFYNCQALQSVDLSPLAGAKIKSIAYAFNNCSALQSVDLSMLDLSELTEFTNPFSGSGVTRVILPRTRMQISPSGLYTRCSAATIAGDIASLPDTSEPAQGLDIPVAAGTGSLYNMFSNCSNLKYVNLANLSGFKPTDISSMFYFAENARAIYWPDVDTSALTRASNFVYKTTAIPVLYVLWGTSQTTVQDIPVAFSQFVGGYGSASVFFVVPDALISQYASNSNFSTATQNLMMLSDFKTREPNLAAAFGL